MKLWGLTHAEGAMLGTIDTVLNKMNSFISLPFKQAPRINLSG